MNFTPVEANVTKDENYLEFLVTAVIKNMIVLFLSITILSVNATMVHTFKTHHILKLNPRYILFINLVLNDMIQLTISTSLYILAHVFRTLYVPLCVFFIFVVSLATINTPLILAFMAAECYISVCFPLRYNNICTLKKTYIVVGIIWATSSLSVLLDIFILVATEQQQFFNSRVFCDRDSLFRSSYSLNRRNAFHIFFLVLVWLTLFYTFFRILFVAKAANADPTKARNTLLLHGFQVLLCMMVYVHPFLTPFLKDLIPEDRRSVNFTIYIMIQIIPRFLNPVVYGLRDKTFRRYLRRYCICLQISFTKTTLKM
ncbi:odorant receptor 131-2-like [Cololabis saira]|uniref:odorant receptor 131-2-like n=1 Tax=Cololabis saira TaxID=129043 RepID=UPI002AD31D76|nr:odorant receptor 131-2-like [Cololabis saira]